MNKFSLVSVFALFAFLAVTPAVFATVLPPPPPPVPPTSVDQCKDEAWRDYGEMFKNQGDCVSFVVTDGRNAPDGPPLH